MASMARAAPPVCHMSTQRDERQRREGAANTNGHDAKARSATFNTEQAA